MDSYAHVDRAQPVPLYHQMFLMLRDEILTGARPYASLLPTEQQLCDDHSVSRVTVRRALEELAQHGLVERRRRTGTRVIHRASTRPIEANIDQAVESLLAFGRDTKVAVLDFNTIPASAEVALRLKIVAGDMVLRAVRIRQLDEQPLGEVVSYVPASFAAALDECALASTPMLALLRSAGHVLGGGEQTISAAVAGGYLANVLGIDDRMPILRIERTVADADGTPLLFTVASYRADRYRIAIDLQTSGRVLPMTL